MKVSKTYRLSSKTVMKIEAICEKSGGACATEIIEKAIDQYYDMIIKGFKYVSTDKYNEVLKDLQNANQVILELNKNMQELLNQIRQLEYEKISLEFKLKEREKQLKTLKERIEKVPFWRKDLSEILNKDIKDLFKPKKEDDQED